MQGHGMPVPQFMNNNCLTDGFEGLCIIVSPTRGVKVVVNQL